MKLHRHIATTGTIGTSIDVKHHDIHFTTPVKHANVRRISSNINRGR
jgi:hypothetical protein